MATAAYWLSTTKSSANYYTKAAFIVCVVQDIMLVSDHNEVEHTLAVTRSIRSDLPMIMVSGYSIEDAISDFHDLSHTAFLQKPFSTDELCHVLQQLITEQ